MIAYIATYMLETEAEGLRESARDLGLQDFTEIGHLIIGAALFKTEDWVNRLKQLVIDRLTDYYGEMFEFTGDDAMPDISDLKWENFQNLSSLGSPEIHVLHGPSEREAILIITKIEVEP